MAKPRSHSKDEAKRFLRKVKMPQDNQPNQHATEPSGPRADNPGTAGPGTTKVLSKTPENDQGAINPSAPEDSNTTPGTTTEK